MRFLLLHIGFQTINIGFILVTFNGMQFELNCLTSALYKINIKITSKHQRTQ